LTAQSTRRQVLASQCTGLATSMASRSSRAACLLFALSLAAPPVAAADAALDIQESTLGADDECSADGCALNAMQDTRGPSAATAAACDVETPCRGCSGEACLYCREEERVKCCLRRGRTQPWCCARVSPLVQLRPVCVSASACDVEGPCRGASGEQRGLCLEEERVKCCIRDGRSKAICCASANPQIQFRPVCASRPACDADAPCRGCSGEQCQLCREEEQVKCCLRDGGSQSHCCANVNFQIRSRPICRSSSSCDVDAPCRGCSGEQCQLCGDEEQVKCCIRDGGSRSRCCAAANPQIRFRPVCS